MGDEPDVTEPQIHVVAAKSDGNDCEAPAGVYEAVYARYAFEVLLISYPLTATTRCERGPQF